MRLTSVWLEQVSHSAILIQLIRDETLVPLYIGVYTCTRDWSSNNKQGQYFRTQVKYHPHIYDQDQSPVRTWVVVCFRTVEQPNEGAFFLKQTLLYTFTSPLCIDWSKRIRMKYISILSTVSCASSKRDIRCFSGLPCLSGKKMGGRASSKPVVLKLL